MKKTDEAKELLFYFKKLPLMKQASALDYVKWLWVSPKEEFTEDEWEKLRALSKTKGTTYKTFEGLEKHLQRLKK